MAYLTYLPAPPSKKSKLFAPTQPKLSATFSVYLELLCFVFVSISFVLLCVSVCVFLINRFAHSAGPGMEKHVGTELTTEGARSTQKPKDNGTGIKKNVGTI